MKAFCKTIVIAIAVLSLRVATADSPGPLFQGDEPLRVTITAPLSALLRARPEAPEFKGVFSYREPSGTPVELDIQVRARGNFRLRICHFPLLHLNFRKSQVEGTLLDHQNKLKMVVHCKDSGRYDQMVLREYLAYRLLNALTDLSFRVRLLQVTYVDSDERRPRIASRSVALPRGITVTTARSRTAPNERRGRGCRMPPRCGSATRRATRS